MISSSRDLFTTGFDAVVLVAYNYACGSRPVCFTITFSAN